MTLVSVADRAGQATASAGNVHRSLEAAIDAAIRRFGYDNAKDLVETLFVEREGPRR